MRYSTVYTVAALTGGIVVDAAGSAYTLAQSYDSSNFFDKFSFIDSPDVYTKGAAQYVGKEAAQSSGLASYVDGKVFLGVDNSTVASGNRNSIRLESADTFDSGLLIADFSHLPAAGCGMWPAFWTLHDGDVYSEIDIVEEVNMASQDQITLFTSSPTCSMTDNGGTGVTRNTNCLLNKPDEAGCGAAAADGSFGAGFNAAGGGIWALQVEADGIKVWNFKKGEVDTGADSLDTSSWPAPVLNFGAGSCDVNTSFKQMKIIINVTFCGSYADGAWNGYADDGSDSCAAKTGYDTCEAYVAAEPAGFDDTYFLIDSVKLFKQA